MDSQAPDGSNRRGSAPLRHDLIDCSQVSLQAQMLLFRDLQCYPVDLQSPSEL